MPVGKLMFVRNSENLMGRLVAMKVGGLEREYDVGLHFIEKPEGWLVVTYLWELIIYHQVTSQSLSVESPVMSPE